MSETYRIVIADDEAIICMDLKEILEIEFEMFDEFRSILFEQE